MGGVEESIALRSCMTDYMRIRSIRMWPWDSSFLESGGERIEAMGCCEMSLGILSSAMLKIL